MKGTLVLSFCLVLVGAGLAQAEIINVYNTADSSVLGTLEVVRGDQVSGYEEICLYWNSFDGPTTGSVEYNIGGSWTATDGAVFYLGGTSITWKGKTSNQVLTIGEPAAAPQSYINFDSTIGTFERTGSGTDYSAFSGNWYAGSPSIGLELTPNDPDLNDGFDQTLLARLYMTPGAGLTFVGESTWGYGGGTTPGLTFTVPAVPEPGTLALLAAGVVGLLAYAWRKRK